MTMPRETTSQITMPMPSDAQQRIEPLNNSLHNEKRSAPSHFDSDTLRYSASFS